MPGVYGQGVRHTSLAEMACPIARTLDVVGEWWTLLIVRDALLGARRFNDFKRTGIADDILSARLKRLTKEGVLEKRLYQVRPNRYEYLLTAKGRALAPVIAALKSWGKEWTTGNDLSPRLIHEICGHEASAGLFCEHCGRPLTPDEVQPQAVAGPTETLAPWAELVLMTAEELLQLPDDEWRYELVEGRLVRMTPTGGKHGRVVMALLLAVGRFVEEQRLGEVFPAETGFWISREGGPDTVLAPDLAFVRAGREPDPGAEGYPRLAPDLVAEIASPSQGREEMAAKARWWLSAGVRLVWIVLPEARTVEVWRDGKLARIITPEEELSGEEVLPGFVYPITHLFP